MKFWTILIAAPTLALAGECVITSKTASQSQAQIVERDAFVQNIVPAMNDRQRCMVSFRARIGNQWFTAHGDQEFAYNEPARLACDLARIKAEAQVKNRVGQTSVATDSVVVCSDQPRHQTLRISQIGTIGNISQFRPNPDRPREFSHNNARCRWFLDNEFKVSAVVQVQGIVCHVNDQNWIVVDKF